MLPSTTACMAGPRKVFICAWMCLNLLGLHIWLLVYPEEQPELCLSSKWLFSLCFNSALLGSRQWAGLSLMAEMYTVCQDNVTPHLCLPHPAVPAMCMKAWSKRGSGDLRSDWWGQDIHGIQVSKLLRKDLIPHGYVPWKEGFWCRSYLMLIEIWIFLHAHGVYVSLHMTGTAWPRCITQNI